VPVSRVTYCVFTKPPCACIQGNILSFLPNRHVLESRVTYCVLPKPHVLISG
jgi:hypothetical protein